jgi:hypothetical protein
MWWAFMVEEVRLLSRKIFEFPRNGCPCPFAGFRYHFRHSAHDQEVPSAKLALLFFPILIFIAPVNI